MTPLNGSNNYSKDIDNATFVYQINAVVFTLYSKNPDFFYNIFNKKTLYSLTTDNNKKFIMSTKLAHYTVKNIFFDDANKVEYWSTVLQESKMFNTMSLPFLCHNLWNY